MDKKTIKQVMIMVAAGVIVKLILKKIEETKAKAEGVVK